MLPFRGDEKALEYFSQGSVDEKYEMLKIEVNRDRDTFAYIFLELESLFETNAKNFSFFRFGAELLRKPKCIELLDQSEVYQKYRAEGAMIIMRNQLELDS